MNNCISHGNCSACVKQGECSSYKSNKDNISEHVTTYESKVKNPASWSEPKWY